MRIGIDISQTGYRGGVANYTKELVRNLLAQDRENEYVLFGSSLRHNSFFARYCCTILGKNQQKFYRFPHPFLELLWNYLHILPIEKFTGKLDLYHSSDWFEPPAACPKVTTVHDLVAYRYPKTLPLRAVYNHKAKLHWAKKESSIILVDSENTKQDLKEIMRIPERKIRVIYLACRKEFVPKSAEEIIRVKKKFGITGNYLLTVGTREPRKNLERIIKSFLELSKQQRESLSLVNVGKYGWGKDVKKSEKQKIKILDYVPDEDLPALYSGAQCLVFASLYEGFGIPILEAMNTGCPVVTSNSGSTYEISGKAAVFVNPENTEDICHGIKEAIQKRKILIKRGFERAKIFSWEKTARETLAVYREIFG